MFFNRCSKLFNETIPLPPGYGMKKPWNDFFLFKYSVSIIWLFVFWFCNAKVFLHIWQRLTVCQKHGFLVNEMKVLKSSKSCRVHCLLPKLSECVLLSNMHKKTWREFLFFFLVSNRLICRKVWKIGFPIFLCKCRTKQN